MGRWPSHGCLRSHLFFIMDNVLTKKIGDWLRADRAARDYLVGVTFLLQLSGNRIENRNLTLRPNMGYLESHLQRYYDFRVQELTRAEVAAMQRKVDAIARDVPGLQDEKKVSKEKENVSRGKRPDHDVLPDDIQALYIENLDILHRMREAHLKLRTLSLETATCPDSERYPFLKELIELDKKYRSNWQRYDLYKL